MSKEPIRTSTPATIVPSVWREGVKLPRYPFRFATSFSLLGQTFAGLIAGGVVCLGLSLIPSLTFWAAMALALVGTALILLPLADRANTRTAPLSIYGMNPHATQRVPCVVILTVDGFELWRDMGVVGFEDVRLVYAGLRTAFSLRPENLFGADPSDSFIRGFRKIRLRLPGSNKVVIELRPFEKFIEGDSENRKILSRELVRKARDSAIKRPAATGPVQWPPLDLLDRSLADLRRSRRWWLFGFGSFCVLAIMVFTLMEERATAILTFGFLSFAVSTKRELSKFEAYLKARKEVEDPASLPGKV